MLFSESIKGALEQEVVGQPRAINSVVRGITRLVAGLTPRERTWCAYLFVGPPGTGRSHLVRTVARTLHGDEQAVLTVSCNRGGPQSDPWQSFLHQLSPLFAGQPGGDTLPGGRRSPRVVLIQDLERGQKEFFPLLARTLETGQVALPGGKVGRLDNCLIFITSGLCSREILEETSRIGFAGVGSQDEDGDEQDSIVRVCREEAEKAFGLELLSQFDSMVVFRRLEAEHLASVLERHLARMNRWLGLHGFRCEMEPAARDFLLERGSRQILLGATDLILAHRREVEFPVADLLVSGEIPPGGLVKIDHIAGADHLHFTVVEPNCSTLQAAGMPEFVGAGSGAREVPIS